MVSDREAILQRFTSGKSTSPDAAPSSRARMSRLVRATRRASFGSRCPYVDMVKSPLPSLCPSKVATSLGLTPSESRSDPMLMLEPHPPLNMDDVPSTS
jgi:hypothetical protein